MRPPSLLSRGSLRDGRLKSTGRGVERREGEGVYARPARVCCVAARSSSWSCAPVSALLGKGKDDERCVLSLAARPSVPGKTRAMDVDVCALPHERDPSVSPRDAGTELLAVGTAPQAGPPQCPGVPSGWPFDVKGAFRGRTGEIQKASGRDVGFEVRERDRTGGTMMAWETADWRCPRRPRWSRA